MIRLVSHFDKPRARCVYIDNGVFKLDGRPVPVETVNITLARWTEERRQHPVTSRAWELYSDAIRDADKALGERFRTEIAVMASNPGRGARA